jgi:hypothetical protein
LSASSPDAYPIATSRSDGSASAGPIDQRPLGKRSVPDRDGARAPSAKQPGEVSPRWGRGPDDCGR